MNTASPNIGETNLSPYALADPFYPRFWPERLLQPAEGLAGFLRTKRKGIFVCDMSDLFGQGVPEEWTRQVMEQCKIFSQHRFYLLTKQPQNLPQWSPFPDNCYIGVTATNFNMYGEALMYLGEIKAKVKYISFEPLLSSLTHNKEPGFYNQDCMTIDFKNWLNWLIIGACTGSKKDMEALIVRYPNLTLMPYGDRWTAQPKLEWVREIVEATDKAGIAVFQKDNLKPLLGDNLRQELPK